LDRVLLLEQYLVVLLVTGLASPKSSIPDNTGPPPKLQGSWNVTALEQDGVIEPNGNFLRLTVTPHRFILLKPDGREIENLAYALDASRRPHVIDFKGRIGGLSAGIFHIAGDELRICVAVGKNKRPKEFRAMKGSGHTLMLLKRAK
jgi:uncharacterized protein (TIGR03067 family)